MWIASLTYEQKTLVLKWLLWTIALVQCSAIAAVLMPRSWMDWCGDSLGVGELSHTPLAGYLARLSSAMYVVHGTLVGYVAATLPKSALMVRPLALTTGLLGLMMLWIDTIEAMPNVWLLVECTALFGSALCMFLLRPEPTRANLQ